MRRHGMWGSTPTGLSPRRLGMSRPCIVGVCASAQARGRWRIRSPVRIGIRSACFRRAGRRVWVAPSGRYLTTLPCCRLGVSHVRIGVSHLPSIRDRRPPPSTLSCFRSRSGSAHLRSLAGRSGMATGAGLMSSRTGALHRKKTTACRKVSRSSRRSSPAF